MTISIHIDGHSADAVRGEMARLLGVSLDAIPVVGQVPQPPISDQQITGAASEAEAEAIADAGGSLSGPAAEASNDAPKPVREHGQPSPGKARRTKAEIAEDDAFEATQTRAFPPTSEPVAGISTGEERIGPEDDAATAEQDAADEAAETAAAKPDGKLTLDDVRNSMGVYVQRYGIEAIQLDGLEVFNRVLGPCTLKNEKGEARTWKVSDLPDDQAVLAKVVAGFSEMLTKNPFGRTAKAA